MSSSPVRDYLLKNWRTRKGQTIPIADMDDRHLINASRLIVRRMKQRLFSLACSASAYAEDAPDGAAMAAEQGIEECIEPV